MANKRDPYITKRIRAKTGARKIQRLIGQGWELAAEDVNHGLRSKREVVLRRPNPDYRGAPGGN